MFCPKCGNKVHNNSFFCEKCGAKLEFGSTAEKSSKILEPDVIKYNGEKLKRGGIGFLVEIVKGKAYVKKVAVIAILFIGVIAIFLIKRNSRSLDNFVDDSTDGFYELEEKYYEEAQQFDRSYYINNAVSMEEFLRYRDYGPCYLERYVVDSVPEDRLYICKNDAGSRWVVIDDSGCPLNSNALPGDTVTVYGRYNDIVELTFTDGSRNNQVPMVYADKLVNNSMLPEDKDEFIDQVIQCMNLSDIMYGSGNEYYGDYNAKIAIGVYYYWAKELKRMRPSYWASLTKEQYFGGWWACRVDGYGIIFEFDSDENIAEPYQNGVITDEDIDFYSKTTGGNIPIYARGRITEMEMVSAPVVRFTFFIDSFETYY